MLTHVGEAISLCVMTGLGRLGPVPCTHNRETWVAAPGAAMTRRVIAKDRWN